MFCYSCKYNYWQHTDGHTHACTDALTWWFVLFIRHVIHWPAIAVKHRCWFFGTFPHLCWVGGKHMMCDNDVLLLAFATRMWVCQILLHSFDCEFGIRTLISHPGLSVFPSFTPHLLTLSLSAHQSLIPCNQLQHKTASSTRTCGQIGFVNQAVQHAPAWILSVFCTTFDLVFVSKWRFISGSSTQLVAWYLPAFPCIINACRDWRRKKIICQQSCIRFGSILTPGKRRPTSCREVYCYPSCFISWTNKNEKNGMRVQEALGCRKAIILPEGAHWGLDLDEKVSLVLQETNSPHQVSEVYWNNHARRTIDKENVWKSL